MLFFDLGLCEGQCDRVRDLFVCLFCVPFKLLSPSVLQGQQMHTDSSRMRPVAPH